MSGSYPEGSWCNSSRRNPAIEQAVELLAGRPCTVEQVLAVLDAVERHDVWLRPMRDAPGDIYCGNVVYEATNGWRLVVFNDCSEWDYLDSARLPNGRWVDFWYGDGVGLAPRQELDPYWEPVRNYQPPRAVAAAAYGIIGPQRIEAP